MGALVFSISSSSATSVVKVRVDQKVSTPSSHGLFRAEIDLSFLIRGGLISSFIAECLQVFGGAHDFIVFSGIEDVGLDRRFSLVTSLDTGSAYKFAGTLSSADIKALLLNLPYGAVAILSAIDDITDELSQQKTMDMDGLLITLGTKLTWAIEYDESGVVTLLAREQRVIWQQIMRVVQHYVEPVV